MNIFINLAPIIISVFAIIMSMVNLVITKRNNRSNVISNNRIKWMNQTRNLLEEFLEEYITGGEEIRLKIIKSQIDLYIRFDSIFIKNLRKN